MSLENLIKERYTVKEFDENKKISEEDMKKVRDLLRYAPSSINIQPWHFYIAGTNEGKEKLLPAIKDYGFNADKVQNASHVIVLTSKYTVDDEHLENILNQEEADGRFNPDYTKEMARKGLKASIEYKKYGFKDENHYLEKQIYINAGQFVLGLKALGIDSVIMEGFDSLILDKILNLHEKNSTAVLMIGIGYGKEDDFNAKLPKSRLDLGDLITELK